MEALELALRQYGGINSALCDVSNADKSYSKRRDKLEAERKNDKEQNLDRKDLLHSEAIPDYLSGKLQQSSKYGMKFTATLALTRLMFYRSLLRTPSRGLERKDFIELFGKSDPSTIRPDSHHILLDMFESLDKDGKNYISSEDVLRFFYPSNSPAEIERKKMMVEDLEDWNSNSHMDYKSNSNSKKLNSDKVAELLEIFRAYDIEGSGRLSLQEFVRAVEESWEVAPEKSEIQKYFLDADRGFKGYITALDWVNWLQQTTYVSLEDLSKGLRHRFQEYSEPEHNIRMSIVDYSPRSTPSTRGRRQSKSSLGPRNRRLSSISPAILETPEEGLAFSIGDRATGGNEVRMLKRGQSAGTQGLGIKGSGLKSAADTNMRRPQSTEFKQRIRPESSNLMVRPWTSSGFSRLSRTSDIHSLEDHGNRMICSERKAHTSALHLNADFLSLGIVRTCVRLSALSPSSRLIGRLLKSGRSSPCDNDE